MVFVALFKDRRTEQAARSGVTGLDAATATVEAPGAVTPRDAEPSR